ncbi:MAG: hypothetical protein ABI840_08730, partial [bacterium]
FVTGWMGENHFHPNTVALYSLILLFCGISYTILQKTIESGLQDGTNFKSAMIKHKNKGIISVACYILAIPLAYINLYISEILLYSVALLWIIPDRNIEKVMEK